jgi:DNA-binding MarR family transcriptional regulator
MSDPVFDEVIHAPNRLQICAMLAAADSVEFGTIRDALEVSDSVLSKQVKILQSAGYVTVIKTPRNSRTHTWLALTAPGRTALSGHLAELRRIADLAVSPGANP